MFKIIYTSDLHGTKPLYERLAKKASEDGIKAIVIGGDLCPRGGATLQETVKTQKDFLEKFMIPLLEKANKQVFLIMGNDDFRINEAILENNNIKNIHYINKKSLKINKKFNIAGYGFVNPTPFRLKDWEKDEGFDSAKPTPLFPEEIRTADREKGTIIGDLGNLGKLSNPKNTIYVIHTPPFNTKLDVITDGTHVGSRAVRQFIEEEQPLLTLHGHIHESPRISGSWRDNIGKTICINAGSSYPENRLNAVIIDLESLKNIKYIEI
ncbi:metallophosphoesterase [Candidatus Woesearchaeota archaeon]|nr:metallophosphoesterase [Candidatus Woesearchaeota archaeon]